MKQLVFGRDIRAKPYQGPPITQRIVPPPEITLDSTCKIVPDPDFLILTFELQNPTAKTIDLIIVMPHPLSASFSNEDFEVYHPQAQESTPPSMPSSSLQTLSVPAQSKILFTTKIAWTSLGYKDKPEGQVHWQFTCAGGPREGTLSVPMPGRTSKQSYFINEVPVSEAQFEARKQTLKLTMVYQEHIEKGGQNLWEGADASGKPYRFLEYAAHGWYFNDLSEVASGSAESPTMEILNLYYARPGSTPPDKHGNRPPMSASFMLFDSGLFTKKDDPSFQKQIEQDKLSKIKNIIDRLWDKSSTVQQGVPSSASETLTLTIYSQQKSKSFYSSDAAEEIKGLESLLY